MTSNRLKEHEVSDGVCSCMTQASTRNTSITGAGGATISSSKGDVLLESNLGKSSLVLTSRTVQGVAETVMFHAGFREDQSPSRSTDAPKASPGTRDGQRTSAKGNGGYLKLTNESATISGVEEASLYADEEVLVDLDKFSSVL